MAIYNEQQWLILILAHSKRYLERIGKEETNKKYQKATKIKSDKEKVAKMK